MDISGISSASMSLLTRNVGSDIGTALLKKALDNEEESNSTMLKLMEQAANPDLGAHVNTVA
ncbi:MAG: YjfB family protein [Oribacterium sp.]|nr:YjfB family protein [Oribacterium sp.]